MKIFTIPISWIYRFIVFIRNRFYDYGFINQKELNCPVISVGNLSAGGTGKTTFTEMVADYFLGRGKFIVIIVKGYKREDADLKVVELGFDNSARQQLNTENMGDEAFIYLENLKPGKGRGLIVVFDDKLKAAKFAASKFKPEIIIVDDGFQHRKLARNLDIVIIDGNEGKRLIPSGKLREPMKNISRADLLVMNKKFGNLKVPFQYETRAGIECNYGFNGFFNISNENMDISGKKVLAFCGIGDPASFQNLLFVRNIETLKILNFADHHVFSNDDIQNIIEEFKSIKADYIITTQKDFLRIKNSEIVLNPVSENIFKELLFNYPLFYTKIIMQISNNKENFYSHLDRLINII